MKLQLSDEDAAFREEMHTFFTTQIPQDVRDTVAARRELSKEQIVASVQAMKLCSSATDGILPTRSR